MELLFVRELAEELQSEVSLAMRAKQPTPRASWALRTFDILIEEKTPERAIQKLLELAFFS
jgi:hypothetical protein